MKNLFFLLSIILVSCNDLEIESKEKVLSPVSLWLVQNEDSLFRFLSDFAKSDTSANKADSEIITREYVLTNGICGALNDQIHNLAACIKVIFLLRPKSNPYFEIFLTPEFDTACVKLTDSIFADIDSLRHFRITKYRWPTGPFSKYITETDTIEPKDIAFALSRSKDKYDVTVYMKNPTTQDTKETLKNEIFGEEILLKRIKSVKFGRLTDTTKGLKSLEEVWKLFGINK